MPATPFETLLTLSLPNGQQGGASPSRRAAKAATWAAKATTWDERPCWGRSAEFIPQQAGMSAHQPSPILHQPFPASAILITGHAADQPCPACKWASWSD